MGIHLLVLALPRARLPIGLPVAFIGTHICRGTWLKLSPFLRGEFGKAEPASFSLALSMRGIQGNHHT
jgi:hypothetical protein